jgi:hypothetical protein
MNSGERADILRRVVARGLARSLEHLAEYDATVVSQGADGALDLRLDDPTMPGLSGVPIWLGLPGVRAEVDKGARVKVGFAEGDPAKPYAGLWATDASCVRIVIGGGTRAVARVDDETDSGTLILRTVTDPVAGCSVEWLPPGGKVPVVLGVLGVKVAAPSVVEVPIRGLITTGLAKLLG